MNKIIRYLKPNGLRSHLCRHETLYGISILLPRFRDDAYPSPQPQRILDIDGFLYNLSLIQMKSIS